MENDDDDLSQQSHVWTAGLGAINSIRSPGGEIRHIFPFQMKETQLEIQVGWRYSYFTLVILIIAKKQLLLAPWAAGDNSRGGCHLCSSC